MRSTLYAFWTLFADASTILTRLRNCKLYTTESIYEHTPTHLFLLVDSVAALTLLVGTDHVYYAFSVLLVRSTYTVRPPQVACKFRTVTKLMLLAI